MMRTLRLTALTPVPARTDHTVLLKEVTHGAYRG